MLSSARSQNDPAAKPAEEKTARAAASMEADVLAVRRWWIAQQSEDLGRSAETLLRFETLDQWRTRTETAGPVEGADEADDADP
ncbi:MAG: hypothetical protein AAGG38_14590 [Planctomycetota bacterium]